MPDPAPTSDAPADLTGRTLGDFHVLRKLGHGGMGHVYLARQLSLKRQVALKLLRDDLAKNATALQRFQAEAEAVARVSHPNIVQVYAVGEHDGLKFMALEYVEGRNLRDFLAKKGPPELPVALAIVRQVAAALQRASELGITHRDVKPENILLTKKVEVKVTDFGLARLTADDQQPLNLTQSGVAIGTPLYMAPEQVQGKPVDHRTDVYSLGVTCYHLLAGQPPFKGNTAFEVAMKHVHDAPEPLAALRPDLPGDLCAMVHKMMAKDPAQRYQTAKDILRDLAKVREGLSLGLPPASLSLTLPPPASPLQATTTVLPVAPSSRWPARALGLMALAALAGGGWLVYARTHNAPDPPSAAGPGLPEARPPEPVVSSRERALLKKVRERGAKPAEVAESLIDLGALYVRERRLDEGEKAFAELEDGKFDQGRPRPPGAQQPLYQTAGRFGKGIVLAYRDKATDSVELFMKGLKDLNLNRQRAVLSPMRIFLYEHAELARAVSDALHRDAENLKAKGQSLPTVLEELRFPAAGERPRG
jgi:serine/threonine-protein kinase